MKLYFRLTSFLLLLLYCSSVEGEKEFRSEYWQYISLNGTSPLLFHNINAFAGNTTGQYVTKQDSANGLENRFISANLISVLPPFAITSENIENGKCKRDSKVFLENLKNLELWALKMHDASGKLPSGLLNGNINQFGDFDQCLGIYEPDLDIKGKYCLAYLQLRPNGGIVEGSSAYQAFKLMQSHFAFKSKLTDPGDRVPRFSTMNWGFCIPNSCSAEDVESHLQSIVERYTNGTGFDVEVRVESNMCQEKKTFKVSMSFAIVSCLFFSIVIISIMATLRDISSPNEDNKSVSFWSIVNCFSFKRNGNALLSLSRSADDVQAIHGIRMINALMLLFSHKSMALFFMPYSDRTSMVEELSKPWTLTARVASMYTDSFVMISGLLTSYAFIKTLKKNGRLDLKNEYINRLIRIIPPLAAIILLSTFIIPELGAGPQWNLTVAHHADKCRKNWWKNFLFVHNYLGFENMCLTHTHHLGIDTQLFFISPILVYLLYKWPVFGLSGLVGIAAISTAARYQVTVSRNLSFFIYPGISVSQMFDTANYSYIIPFHRLTVYIMGIILGYILRQYGKDYRIKSNFLKIGWTLTFSFLFYILTKANDMNRTDYVYDNHEAAMWAALSPISLCLFLGWTTFVSQIDSAGIVGRLLCSKYCLIWTRLSYAFYLTQFPIFFFNVGLQKHSQQYSFFLLVNILEYFCVLIASIFLTLLIDMPFNNLKKLFISR